MVEIEGFEPLLEKVHVYSFTITMNPRYTGVVLQLHLKDSSGASYTIQSELSYDEPEGTDFDSSLTEQLRELMEDFQEGTVMDVLKDVSIDLPGGCAGGLRFMVHDSGWLFDLYGSKWQLIQ